MPNNSKVARSLVDASYDKLFVALYEWLNIINTAPKEKYIFIARMGIIYFIIYSFHYLFIYCYFINLENFHELYISLSTLNIARINVYVQQAERNFNTNLNNFIENQFKGKKAMGPVSVFYFNFIFNKFINYCTEFL